MEYTDTPVTVETGMPEDAIRVDGVATPIQTGSGTIGQALAWCHSDGWGAITEIVDAHDGQRATVYWDEETCSVDRIDWHD